MALRVALGAGRLRLFAQLVAENLLLALVAAAAGLAIAHWGVPALVALVPSGVAVPGLAEAGINNAVLGYALAIALTASLAVLRDAGVDAGDAARDGRSGRPGPRRESPEA